MTGAELPPQFNEAEKRLFAQSGSDDRRGYQPKKAGPEPEDAPDGAAGASSTAEAVDNSSGDERPAD